VIGITEVFDAKIQFFGASLSISSKILPKEINPNHYLPYNIPGLEIIISLILI